MGFRFYIGEHLIEAAEPTQAFINTSPSAGQADMSVNESDYIQRYANSIGSNLYNIPVGSYNMDNGATLTVTVETGQNYSYKKLRFQRASVSFSLSCNSLGITGEGTWISSNPVQYLILQRTESGFIGGGASASYYDTPQRYLNKHSNFTKKSDADVTYIFSGITPVPTGYTISFVTNGGSEVETLEEQTNLPNPLPTTTRDGFAFTGWYTEPSLIFPAVPGAEISEDTTLYAGWRPNQFTVTFETNGGEPVSQLTNVNQLPDPLPVTLKTGNDFAGWFTDSEFLHPAVPGAFITQNTTLYAKWVEQQSTDIHVPTVSTPSLLQTGFVTMWNPTLEEVRQLSNFLWTTNLFDNLRKLFNDPMEAILFLGIVPFDVNTAERGNIYFGNLDTDVESTPIVQQYYTLDFGDIDMTEYYHSFLDYEPATTVEIFLPFCGTHKLSANEVMGSVMNLKYNVDVFTGTCVAMLTITKPGIDSVMYSFEGNVMSTIPVTAKNYSDFLRSAVSTVASAIALGAMI